MSGEDLEGRKQHPEVIDDEKSAPKWKTGGCLKKGDSKKGGKRNSTQWEVLRKNRRDEGIG